MKQNKNKIICYIIMQRFIACLLILKYIIQKQILKPNLEILNNNTYTYDNVGNKLSKQDSVGTHNYTYDNTYQLSQATHPTIPTEAFAYDQVGNRTNTTVDAANKLLQDPNATYQYDANGNRYVKTQSDGTIVYYSYDYEGRLTRVESQKPGLTTIAIYKYDPLGRRIEKAVTENSITTTTHYLYDGFNILAEYDENNNVKAQYIHNLGIDDQLAMVKNGQTYYYHKDGLGSITKISDSTGTVVQSYEYDSFGNITNRTGTINQPYTFTGREYDSESGLYYLRARELDPKTGTFTQKDPIGFKGGDANLYRYVWNRPTGYIDPDGKIAIADDAAVIGFITLSAITVAYLESPAGQEMLRNVSKSAEEVVKEIEEWAKNRLETSKCEVRTPWQGPGKKFDPNEPPDPKEPWWKKAVWAAGRIIKLMTGWPD